LESKTTKELLISNKKKKVDQVGRIGTGRGINCHPPDPGFIS
jgi:hypothetical protein